MNIGVYQDTKDELDLLSRNLIVRELRKLGYAVSEHDCLCSMEALEPGLDGILSHPHRTNPECLEKTRKIIENNPNVKFYVIALTFEGQEPASMRIIGHPKNVEYIARLNTAKTIKRLIDTR